MFFCNQAEQFQLIPTAEFELSVEESHSCSIEIRAKVVDDPGMNLY